MYRTSNVICAGIFLLFLNHNIVFTQPDPDYFIQEITADSLMAKGRFLEAGDKYMTLFNSFGKKAETNTRARIAYKAGYSLFHADRELSARTYFQAVINMQEKIADTGLVCDAMSGLGQCYEYTGLHDSAFYWYMEAYKKVIETPDTARIARDLRNMAQLFRVLKKYNEARTYCRKAVELIPGISDFRVVANIYNEAAYLFELSGNLDSARIYYQRMIGVSVENGYQKGESVGYSNLACVFEAEENYRKALDLKKKGLIIDQQMGNRYGMMASYYGLSSTYLLMHNYQDALSALMQAEELCDTSWIVDLSGIEKGYYQVYKAMKRFDLALEHYEEFMRLNDRIKWEESEKQVNELLTRYETEKKEQQIKILEQENMLNESMIRTQWQLIGILILAGLLIIMSAWLWIRSKNQALKTMKMELQQFLLSHGKDKKQTGTGHATEPVRIYRKWGLTPRESEILYHLGKGCTNADIAERLFVSENTVKFHIKNIYIKLDVKNRIQALIRCNGKIESVRHIP